MKRNTVKCPLCGKDFDPLAPLTHIQQHHNGAKDSELALIRDARRKCFGKPMPIKRATLSILPQVSIYNAGYRNTKNITAR